MQTHGRILEAKRRPVTLSLVVDDYGVKYIKKNMHIISYNQSENITL